MKKIVVGAALLAAIALLAGFVVQGPMHSKRAYGFVNYRINSLLDEIKASDSQRAQVNAIKDELFNDGLALKQANRNLRKDLVAQWDSDVVDSAKIHTLVNDRVEAFRAFARCTTCSLRNSEPSSRPSSNRSIPTTDRLKLKSEG